MTRPKHTSGPWKAHLNVPTAAIEGHIVKADHGAETPIASLWKGGGTHGVGTQKANALLIAAAPDLLAACETADLALMEAITALRVNGAAKPGSTYEALKADREVIKAAIRKATEAEG